MILSVQLPSAGRQCLLACAALQTVVETGLLESLSVTHTGEPSLDPYLTELRKQWDTRLSESGSTFKSSRTRHIDLSYPSSQLEKRPAHLSSLTHLYWVKHFQNLHPSLRTVEPQPVELRHTTPLSANGTASGDISSKVGDAVVAIGAELLEELSDSGRKHLQRLLRKQSGVRKLYALLDSDREPAHILNYFPSDFFEVELLEPVALATVSNHIEHVIVSNSLAAHISCVLGLPTSVAHSSATADMLLPFSQRAVVFDREGLQDIEMLQALLEPRVLPRKSISAFVICKNEELNIERCLRSVAWCDEIVLVDSGSTDRTVEKAAPFGIQLHERDWSGHRDQKEFALAQCRSEWVLNLDADEELSWEAREEILALLGRDVEQLLPENGFAINRVMWFLGVWWLRGGWYPEFRLRLLRRRQAEWGGSEPHEKAIVHGPTGKLSSYLYHFSFDCLEDYVATMNRFSSIAARDGASKRRMLLPAVTMALRGVSRFIKFFFLRRGYRHGTRGFVVAVIEGVYAFLKYSKYWEERLDVEPTSASAYKEQEKTTVQSVASEDGCAVRR